MQDLSRENRAEHVSGDDDFRSAMYNVCVGRHVIVSTTRNGIVPDTSRVSLRSSP